MVCPELHFNLSKQMHNHKCYVLHLYFPSPYSLQNGHYHFTEPPGCLFSCCSNLSQLGSWAGLCTSFGLDQTPSAALAVLPSVPFPVNQMS